MPGPRSLIASSSAVAVAAVALIASLAASTHPASGVTTTSHISAQAASSRLLPATGLTFHNLRLINNWTAFTDPRSGPPGYAVSGGVVYLRGAVCCGEGVAQFAVLPRSLRPAHILWIPVVNTGSSDGGLRILQNGVMAVFNNQADPNIFTSLSGVSYPLNS